jgi:hypothetical protein
LDQIAARISSTRLVTPVDVGVVWALYFRNEPKDHPVITEAELAQLPPRPVNMRPQIPWGPLLRRMWPITLTYFCYGWSLWLYLNWLPPFFKNNHSLDIKNSALFASGVFFAGVVGDSLGGILSDPHFQEDRQHPLCAVERHDYWPRRRPVVAASDPVHSRHHGRRLVLVGGVLLR